MSSDAGCTIREVAKDVWTFSCPFSLYGFAVGGRSTAIRLRNGDVWVLASTPLDHATRAKLDELGPVKWIVGADIFHHLFLEDFKKRYPEAKIIAVDGARHRPTGKGLQFDGAWGADPPNTKYGFEDDIQHCYFSGFLNKDVAFLHPASKSMIQADLLFNFPAREQYSKVARPFLGLSSLSPYTWTNKQLLWLLGRDKEAMRRDAKTVAEWDFDRIIPCHGDVIEKDAKKAWKEAYKWFLN